MSDVRGAADVAVYFVPPNHQLYGGRLFEREGNPFAGDRILAPFAAVHERLTSAGIAVHTADALPDRPDGKLTLVIAYGMPERHVSESVRRFVKLARRADV